MKKTTITTLIILAFLSIGCQHLTAPNTGNHFPEYYTLQELPLGVELVPYEKYKLTKEEKEVFTGNPGFLKKIPYDVQEELGAEYSKTIEASYLTTYYNAVRGSTIDEIGILIIKHKNIEDAQNGIPAWTNVLSRSSGSFNILEDNNVLMVVWADLPDDQYIVNYFTRTLKTRLQK